MGFLLFLVTALTALFAGLRFAVPVHGLDLTGPTIFKDLAHVFVGTLVGLALAGLLVMWRVYRFLPPERWEAEESDRVMKESRKTTLFCVFCGFSAVLLTVVEVIAAIVRG